jgi:hypothetical protein
MAERFYSEMDKVDLHNLNHKEEEKGFGIAFRIVNDRNEVRHSPAHTNWIATFHTSDGTEKETTK